MNRIWFARVAIACLLLTGVCEHLAAQENRTPAESIDIEKLKELIRNPGPCDSTHLGPCVDPACSDIRLIDDQGLALRDRAIRVRRIEIKSGRKPSIQRTGLSRPITKLKTNQEGRVSLAKLSSGKYVLEVRADGAWAYITVVLKQPGQIEQCGRTLQLNRKDSTLALADTTNAPTH